MSSMIDQVREAEAQADAIRQDAQAAAREKIAAAQAEIREQKLIAADEERAALREAGLKAEAEGEALSKELILQRSAEADANCKAAEEKLPEAVNYLVERVVKGS